MGSGTVSSEDRVGMSGRVDQISLRVTPSSLHQESQWAQLGFLPPGCHRAENQVSARLASQLEALGDNLLPDLFRRLEKPGFWEAQV